VSDKVEPQNEWKDIPGRRRLLCKLAVSAGVPLGAVTQALQIEKIADFKGSMLDADLLLQNYALDVRRAMLRGIDEQLAGTEREHHEAPAVIWTEAFLPGLGIKVSITARSHATPEEVMAPVLALDIALKTLVNAGILSMDKRRSPSLNGEPPKARPKPAPAPAPATSPPASHQGAPPPMPMANPPVSQTHPPTYPTSVATPVAQTIKKGSARVKSIEIRANGHVEFNVEGLRYPLKDARGAEMVLQLFDPALGWEIEHFFAGASYVERTIPNYWVDWEKPDKYYNVTRVYYKEAQ